MPPLWPDLIFRLLPGVGLLSTCAALTFLVALRRVQMDGFLAVIYVQRVLDLLLGLSLFYAGFHGIHLSVQYGSEQDAHQMPPIQCLFTALHLHIWVYTDSAQLLLLTLLCVDQFISVAWTKRHKEFSEYYFHPGVLAVLLVCASGAFVPAWHAPIRLADNGTVQISSFCEMPETFGQHFYRIYLLVRELAPVPAIGALSATAFAVLTLQLVQRGRFKWSDNNCQSAKCLLLILCRSLLLLAAVHLPLATLRRPRLSHELLEFREHGQEVALRAFQAALFAMCQPLLDVLLLPEFLKKIGDFFNLTELKRTWQSADDPPVPNRSVATSGWDMFGSFHSNTGNIIGEAGLPMQLNASVQRSVSFYYKDGD